MLAIVIFLLAKFLAYSTFCMFAPRWLDFHVYHRVKFGFTRGAIRMLIGLIGMVLILLILTKLAHSGLSSWHQYFMSYVPVRVLEWLTLYLIIALPVDLSFRPHAVYWILAGVLISSLFDLVLFAPMGSRFLDFKWSC